MKERPILFNAPMVRALLNGTKTQTRRIVQKMPVIACPSVCRLLIEQHPFSPSAFTGTPAEGKIGGKDRLAWVAEDWVKNIIGAEELTWLSPKYGVPGDRLWVRETFAARATGVDDLAITYAADNHTWGIGCAEGRVPDDALAIYFRMLDKSRDKNCRSVGYPSIFMPPWLSRITLEITAVRVERLNDISAEDAMAEGIDTLSGLPTINAITDYRTLWESINGAGSRELNPWVWVIEFRMFSS